LGTKSYDKCKYRWATPARNKFRADVSVASKTV
jgi:hypothetical protein